MDGLCKGKERDKRINRISKFLLLLVDFVVWMAHYSTVHSGVVDG